jgi:hypothetical protein
MHWLKWVLGCSGWCCHYGRYPAGAVATVVSPKAPLMMRMVLSKRQCSDTIIPLASMRRDFISKSCTRRVGIVSYFSLSSLGTTSVPLEFKGSIAITAEVSLGFGRSVHERRFPRCRVLILETLLRETHASAVSLHFAPRTRHLAAKRFV